MDPFDGGLISQLVGAVDTNVLTGLVVAILGGGGVAAILSYRKTGAEAEQIAANTLIAVNGELRSELARCHAEIAALRERIATLESLDRQRRGEDPIPPPD